MADRRDGRRGRGRDYGRAGSLSVFRGWCYCVSGPISEATAPTKTRRASVTRQVSPAKQVSSFIAKFDPPVQTLIRSARRSLRRRWPTSVELVYDNYNALAIGYGSSERASDVIVSIAAFARGVNLYFNYGKALPDPKRLLNGAGNQGRFIRLESASLLANPDVDALLRAAAKHGKTPLAAAGRGYTLVKSISARQRPRRV